jgi:hypothetical protein
VKLPAVAVAVTAAAALTTGLVVACGTSTRPAADPDTASAAARAATRELADMHTGRYDDAWSELAPAIQASVPRATWTGFYSRCRDTLASYQMVYPVLDSDDEATVVVLLSYTGPGFPGGAGPVQMIMGYIGGRWRYEPPLAMWRHSSVSAIIAAAHQGGLC